MSKEQIEKERWDIAKIMADNFHINGEGWDESDFEWTAHCLQMAGFRKQSEGRWTPRHKDTKAFCTECGALRDVETQEFWSFCPNCGAKMKGGAE